MAQFQDEWRAGGTGRGPYIFEARGITQVPVIAKGASGQTSNLIEAQNSAGTVVFSVSNEGNVMWTGSTIIVVDEVISGNLTVGGTTILGTTSGDALTVNATSTFNADVIFSTSLLLPDGTLSAPALAFTNDTDMGFFRNALNQMTLVTNGSARMLWTNNSISSYVDFIPTVSDGAALGTDVFMWSDLKLASGGVVNFNAGNVTITHSTGVLTLAGDLLASNAAGPAFIDEAATATNPTLCPDKAEEDTGIGWQSDVIHIVLGGGNEYAFSATTLDMQANTITDCGNITMTAGANKTISVATDNTEGDTLTVVAGSGGTGAFNGGATYVTGGAGGSDGNRVGGAVYIEGGVDGNTSVGGATYIRGGAGNTNGIVYLGDSNTASISVGAGVDMNSNALTEVADIFVDDGFTIGISGNELLTFNSGGTIAVSTANLELGGNNIQNVGTVSGEASTTSLTLAGGTANAQRDVIISTVDAAGSAQVTRLTFASDADSSTATFNACAVAMGTNDITTTGAIGRDTDNEINWTTDDKIDITIAGATTQIASITTGGGSDNDKLVTQGYVDTALTAEDLDTAGDTGTGSVDLDSQSLTIAGTANEITTVANAQSVTISLPAAVTLTTSLTVTSAGALDADGMDLVTGNDYQINNTSVLNATTLGGAVLASSLTSLGTIASLVASTADINGGTLDGVSVGTDGTVSALTLTEKASIALDPAGGADGDYSGITITGTAGAILAFGETVYLAAGDSKWEKTDADADATAGAVMVGIVVIGGAEDATVTIMTYGQIRADAAFPALTIGAPVFLGTDVGDIQVAAPAGAGDIQRIVGHALTANEILFNPSADYQEV